MTYYWCHECDWANDISDRAGQPERCPECNSEDIHWEEVQPVPDTVYLQRLGADGEITWCADRINNSDVVYRRAEGKTKTHDLKVWPEYFQAIINGGKTFEVRKNDRDFHCYDTLLLREYDPGTDEYTGNIVKCVVKYILYGPAFGISDGYCVMSIETSRTGLVENRSEAE